MSAISGPPAGDHNPLDHLCDEAERLAEAWASRWRENPRTLTRAEFTATLPERERQANVFRSLLPAAIAFGGRQRHRADVAGRVDDLMTALTVFLFQLPQSYTSVAIPIRNHRNEVTDLLVDGDIDAMSIRQVIRFSRRADWTLEELRRNLPRWRQVVAGSRPDEDRQLAQHLASIASATGRCREVAAIVMAEQTPWEPATGNPARGVSRAVRRHDSVPAEFPDSTNAEPASDGANRSTRGGPPNHGHEVRNLTSRQLAVLDELLTAGAVTRESAKTTAVIAEAVDGKRANPKGFKGPVADLRKRGMIETARGSGSGIWLAPEGRRLAEERALQRSKKERLL